MPPGRDRVRRQDGGCVAPDGKLQRTLRVRSAAAIHGQVFAVAIVAGRQDRRVGGYDATTSASSAAASICSMRRAER